MNSTNKTNQKTSNPKIQSFLESLRKRRASGGESKAYSPINLQKERQLEQKRKNEFFQARQKEFNEVYSRKKQEDQVRIEQLRNKLEELATSVKKLDKQVSKAVNTQPTQTGLYQESFIDHLFQVLELIKRSVDNANTWLHVFNQMKKKKGHYWGQVKKQGAKYMLSEERQLATSVG